MEYNEAVGITLRRLRNDKQLTLRQVAAKSYIALGHLSDLETNNKTINCRVLEQVSINGLGIEMDVLMKEIYKTLKESK